MGRTRPPPACLLASPPPSLPARLTSPQPACPPHLGLEDGTEERRVAVKQDALERARSHGVVRQGQQPRAPCRPAVHSNSRGFWRRRRGARAPPLPRQLPTRRAAAVLWGSRRGRGRGRGPTADVGVPRRSIGGQAVEAPVEDAAAEVGSRPRGGRRRAGGRPVAAAHLQGGKEFDDGRVEIRRWEGRSSKMGGKGPTGGRPTWRQCCRSGLALPSVQSA